MFDAVISNGSLHEWQEPDKTIDEIWRVLKPQGKVFISDLRRDINPCMKWFMWLMTKPREIRPGFLTSVAAAYIPHEIEKMMKSTRFKEFEVKSNLMGVQMIARSNKSINLSIMAKYRDYEIA